VLGFLGVGGGGGVGFGKVPSSGDDCASSYPSGRWKNALRVLPRGGGGRREQPPGDQLDRARFSRFRANA